MTQLQKYTKRKFMIIINSILTSRDMSRSVITFLYDFYQTLQSSAIVCRMSVTAVYCDKITEASSLCLTFSRDKLEKVIRRDA